MCQKHIYFIKIWWKDQINLKERNRKAGAIKRKITCQKNKVEGGPIKFKKEVNYWCLWEIIKFEKI